MRFIEHLCAPTVTIQIKTADGTHELFIDSTYEQQAHLHFINQVTTFAGIPANEFGLIRVETHPDDNPNADDDLTEIFFIATAFSASTKLGWLINKNIFRDGVLYALESRGFHDVITDERKYIITLRSQSCL